MYNLKIQIHDPSSWGSLVKALHVRCLIEEHGVKFECNRPNWEFTLSFDNQECFEQAKKDLAFYKLQGMLEFRSDDEY